MRKNLLLVGLFLVLATNLAFAQSPYSTHYRHQPKYFKGGYKGEVLPPPRLPEAPCPHYTFGAGPYVGLSAGLRTNYNSQPSNYKGLEGIFSAGYSALFYQRLYLAGEAFVEGGLTLQSYSNNNNPTGNNLNPKSTWNVGISALPGFLISDNILGYLRVGMIRTNFSNASPSASVNGGQVGFGLETTLDEHWDLRAEYDYDFYRSISGSQLAAVKSDHYNLGLVYKF